MIDTMTSALPFVPRPVTPVGILAQHLERALARLEADPGSDTEVLDEVRSAYALAAGLDPYLSACTTPESGPLARLAKRTQDEDWDLRSDGSSGPRLEREMLSGHVEGQTLKMLVHLTRARRVLEIGMFTGYSALAMAEALPADGRIVACEIDAGAAAFAIESFAQSAAGHKIDVQVAPGLVTLAQLAAARETFELIFLDADKAGYVDYLAYVLDHDLLAPHGVLCADNTLMQGQPYLPGPSTPNGVAIAEFNRAVAADPRVEQVVLPLRDGLTLIRRVDSGHLT